MAYFNKVLIANRGEIALRIIDTCKKLGIQTVAVYSEADADAPFVHAADEAVCVGPSQAKKSYLVVDKIIDVAKETNTDAIHPGYGFLSENPDFVERCEKENITFIGPSADIMKIMGSKLSAREQMQKANVPVVPGSEGKLNSIEEALETAETLGYPLMLKASAGGGGIGMKLVHSREELERAFDSTVQQAESYFNDGAVFLEKLITKPRHIEVQVVADHHGNVVHVFERECSVQRRNQKIIEESPSPFLNEEKRAELLEAAVRGVKEIGYTNAGTMEFIFDEDGSFYFLEMNTRLQVEHPVTEEVSGLDLVEWQLKVAAGEKLPLVQEDIQKQGHAIECRLYAEDPKTFFPSPGTIEKLTVPSENVRLDFGVIEGSKVTPFYDPMIGKIIVHGAGRSAAIENMKRVLDQIEVEGLTTNLDLLKQIMENKDFVSGNYTTQFIKSLGLEGVS
ncbi:acetyl-CoA carboxylase biotin carboxylase subunit [Alteribacillus iranensis]|uniref:biotin carboxylase n=1 Tax=Alteribacillus iranensis TaxID=930128 RepID=A0A1I2BAG0_9BACI|nr:acetyl-CoA carboxylase biotin carboxylase subunit [Alteribacillus iranensis]SFE52977.1 acetyl-CoA carboxylase, biotin carboxylase subunit [Alteribacillus iranensis]